MPRTHPQQPLVILCELCGERIQTTRDRARYVAIDHAIDFHRPKLLASRENYRRYFRYTNPATGKPARLSK